MKLRKDKNAKRRLALEKRNVKQETNRAMYGAESGAAVVVGKTKEMNRRFVAAFMALVFALSCLIVGVNFATKAQGSADTEGYGMLETKDESTGMVLRKGYLQTAGQDTETPDDDVYSLKIEAYATKDTTTKALKENIPLDIVMVLDQSESMKTEDVLKGKDAYQKSDKDKFTISDIENGEYYYYVESENKWYPVSFKDRDETVEDSYVLAKNDNGNVIESWTAAEVRSWVQSNGKNLFYKHLTDQDNDGYEFEKVWVEKAVWYKNAGQISVNNFQSSNKWYYYTNNPDLKNDYYYNSEGDISKNKPFWHRVFENTEGVTTDGFYVYLWYYTGGERAFASGKTLASKQIGGIFETAKPTDEYTGALKNETVKRVPNDNSYVRNNRVCDAWNSYTGVVGSDVNYTGGQLYLRQSVKDETPFNRMWTSNGDNGKPEIETLAWPLSQSNPNSNVIPGSSTHSGNFYTPGYLLYYTDASGDHYIGEAVDDKGADAYVVADNQNIQLYEKETITRLEAQEKAAKSLAEKIAAATTESADHRIAVVGYNGNGTVATNLVSATETETIASAISGREASGGTSLAAGLSTAANDVFANNPLDPADSRKRIVIVFGDKEAWDASNNDVTRKADAVLKDTYNASVYTIGMFKGAPDGTTEQLIKELSSEYFSSAANPTNYTEMNNGTYHYLANSDTFPEDAASIYSAFDAVATAINQPTTKFVLDATTAVLKDIIHENFNLPANPKANTSVKVAVADSYTDGEPNWGTAQSSGLDPNWTDRTLTVTGFDYDANYVSEDRPSSAGKGEKIIVTIDGLTVNQRVRTESKSAKRIYFNAASSGIYKTGAEDLVVNNFPRPFLDDKTWLAPAGGTGTMNDDGIVVNKYLTPTENGNYDLTVEAYTTQTSTAVTEKIPTDFIVVADQSGSMAYKDMPTGYKAVSGTKKLEDIANGDYYVLGDDGNYYRVYGTRNYLYRYYEANSWYVGDLIDRFGTNLGWFMSDTESETTFQNQMYFREVKGGNTYYQPITMTVQGKIGAYYIKFRFDSVQTGKTYYFDRDNTQYSNNGNSPWYKNVITGGTMKSGLLWSTSDAAVQAVYRDDNAYTFSEVGSINTGMFINYPMYDRHVGYNQLCYRDVNGNEHILASTTGQNSWEFCNDKGQVLTSQKGSRPDYTGLYEATGYQTRLDALKYALTEFATAVANEKNSDNSAVDNRIAIVGFSSPEYATYQNTELLTGESWNISGTNGVRYDQATDSNYQEALVSATNNGTVGSVNNKVTNAINALTANGGTHPEDGLTMAYNILDKRPTKTYTIQTGEETTGKVVDRNTIVIYFTDGRPGDYSFSDQYGAANKVVDASKNIKTLQNPEGSYPNVFSIGVFGESDGNPLTYKAFEESKAVAAHEYDPGWTETYRYQTDSGTYYGNFYYLNRNWRSGSPADYGANPSDTIYDYMSVVSSNYPSATQFMKVKPSNKEGEADLTGYDNYLGMVNGVRGSYIGSNDYYRMASNQDTLVAAFSTAVTMMNQTISSSERLDAASVMQDVFNNTSFKVEDGYSIRATTVDGSMDKYGIVTFKEDTRTPANGVITNLKVVNDNQTVTVTGFDYLENYINYGTLNEDGTVAIPQHDGKKLVVTISNVVPTVTGDQFFSNISKDSASAMYVGDHSVQKTDFPTPSISRHKYTLDVGDVNPNATFTVAMNILDSNGNEVSKDSSMLDDVILVYPNGTRKLYSEVGPQTFLAVQNEQSFYLENLPSTYKVQVDVTSTDDAYIYRLRYDDEAESANRPMTKGTPIETNFNYADHVIHITSARGTKEVSIRERTIGSYGDTTHQFGEVITMDIPVLTGEELKLEYDCVFNDTFSGFENGLPKDATEYKAVFEVDASNSNDSTKSARLVRIDYYSNGTKTGSWDLPNNELPMRDGDEITFTKVPVGNTIKAQEPEANWYDHTVYYYYGQDDVSPSGIKLMTSSGELLEGTHTFTFMPVDGLTADDLTVTFENGSITKINGKDVTANDAIDFEQYQTMYALNDDLGDAKLSIDGTDVYFDTETNEDDTAYVATIKRQTNRPPVSVIVEKNNMDILIINERGDIEIEGIFDSNHNAIIYILSAAGVLALAAGGYYVWKKKDELTRID